MSSSPKVWIHIHKVLVQIQNGHLSGWIPFAGDDMNNVLDENEKGGNI